MPGYISFTSFKGVVYTGLIFYMLVGNITYSSYGDCMYLDVAFRCTEAASGAEYAWYPCYDYKEGAVGCYATSPQTYCWSTGIVIPGGSWFETSDGGTRTMEDLYNEYNNKTCVMPNGTTWVFDASQRSASNLAGILQCRTSHRLPNFSTLAVLLLMFGMFVYELCFLCDTEVRDHPVWILVSYPVYLMTLGVLLAGLLITAYLHLAWVHTNPQSRAGTLFFPSHTQPCKTPSRIGTLLALLAILIFIAEVIELVYMLFFYTPEKEKEA
eukprot:TRINITY_DN3823_c0_g1_i2.p1 TRINITY_DN3823_c0_g1~~TRINITY_DN3823_c0_g1_i2.p1  ORF type:complete len:269 (-),score=14.73 TRINITY_DN3823_c0_g1_i2:155-961(-)